MDAINVTPAAPTARPAGNEKLWAILCHLCGFVGVFGITIILPLVVYLTMRDESEYLAANAREALNFHISLFLWMLVGVALIFVFFIGVPLLILAGIAGMILSIIGAVKASEGACYRYPLTIRFVK